MTARESPTPAANPLKRKVIGREECNACVPCPRARRPSLRLVARLGARGDPIRARPHGPVAADADQGGIPKVDYNFYLSAAECASRRQAPVRTSRSFINS